MATTRQAGIALATGVSRGIGAAVARRLARDGFTVAVNYVSNPGEADKLVAELTQSGGKALAVQGDVSKADEVRRMFDRAEQELGKIDVLVNNAGILKTQPLAQASDELFARNFGINVGGRTVNRSSTTLALNLPGYAIYNGTKGAVEGMTRVFAKELRGRTAAARC